MQSLLDPSLLKDLTEEQKKEALATAAAAKRAEERAEQRAIERALKQREKERLLQQQREKASEKRMQIGSIVSQHGGSKQPEKERLVYIPQTKRYQQGNDSETRINPAAKKEETPQQIHKPDQLLTSLFRRGSQSSKGDVRDRQMPHGKRSRSDVQDTWLSEKELSSVKESYLGKSVEEKEEDAVVKRKKQRTTKKITFKFRWEDEEDTFDDSDPLYNSVSTMSSTVNSRSSTSRHQRAESHKPGRKQRLTDSLMLRDDSHSSYRESVQTKPLSQMTARDWRILRENHEITVKGGKAPPPMRSFRENPSPCQIPHIHPTLLDAVENVLRFQDVTPIQRQAIPIGLHRRDLIGIAETGSGKTVAFGLPLCHYLLNLPEYVLLGVAADGPLGLVMAPTRELALQIDRELQKLLSRQRLVKTGAVVGGQSIQHQAQMIRQGIHIIVGTPGRLNECIEMAYLVLNQCCYLVLDEADRMLDMGFAPQIESIMNAMGGTLKSEQEHEAYKQEQDDLRKADVARHRLTAMFSATMPVEVERLAKKYLRHPAVVSIGDEDSVKNSRITQRVIFVASLAHKEKALRDQLKDPRFLREKVIVFVNEKKHADQVGRLVERSGRACVVMHGGKSQEQREENLEIFRKGGVVMVATDVAGRGLDIPDVAHVINYDLPTRSIENYTHRIGRTGRAGKQGMATSFITDEDEAIMAPLKAYLKSTGNTVPDRLARHPAANDAASSGNLIY